MTAAAHRCGYYNTSSFIEQFRRALGTTPGAYLRNLHRDVATDGGADTLTTHPADEPDQNIQRSTLGRRT